MTLDVATALFTAGRTEEALAHCKQHLSRNPDDSAAWDLLGAMLHNMGQYRPAIEALRRSLQLKADEPHVLGHLAAALKGAGDLPAAEAAAQKALRLRPDNEEVLNSYGNLLNDMHRSFEAEEVFRKAIAANPAKGTPYGNLAYTMFLLGRNSEGEVYARRGLQVEPDSAMLQNSLGSAVMGQDRLVEAAAYFRRAVELDPGFTVAHSNLLFCRNYDPEASAEDIFADYRGWDELHGLPLVPASPTFENDRDPDRRIRLGLVSPDFRRHAANYFLEPLLEAHDRQEVELFLYGMVPSPDKYTERYQALAAGWRNVIGLGDEEMAARIREDRIDILVDFAGHTARNRLKVFARRPAPVMVAYLVGLGYTTGMSVFDGFFADDAMAPPDAAHLFSEPVLRLSRFAMTYRPPEDMPAIGPLPAASAGHVTFGSFSRTVRINARVVRAWARILKAVPDARLMLNTKAFAEEETRQTYRDMFAREGVDPGRLQLVFTQPQTVTWATYNKIDIALDPFPHNAGTTTFEALWMGVPVISRMDRPSVGRFGASILHALGHPEWLAADDEEYVRCAVALAADIDGLAKLRSGMREAMRRSPLMDARGLAREMEGHYRRLWRGWCTGETEAQPDVRADPFLLYRRSQVGGSPPAAADPPADSPAGSPADPGAQAAPPQRHAAIEQLFTEGRHREALAAAARTSAEHPGDVRMLVLLAKAFTALDRRSDAEGVLCQAHALADGDEAMQCEVDALRSAGPGAVAVPPSPGGGTPPDDPSACRQRAEAAHAQGQVDVAESWYRRLLALKPDDAGAANNLAAIMLDTGRPAEAQAFAGIAARHAPESPQVIGNLAMALCEQADLANGLQMLQKLVDEGRASARVHANLLFAQNYDPQRDAATIRRTAEGWAARHAPAGAVRQAFATPPQPAAGRRLRVGYVSPDFRVHATLNFLLPMLQAHDRTAVEVHLYAEVPAPDAASALYRQAAEGWHDTCGRDDDEVAAQVRQDGIDVLVDLAGHTSSARLGLFARRAAPVQLTYPLGFGASTGLRQFDGVIADASLAPPGSDADFTEPVQRLDGAWSAFRPQSPFPNVGPLPADRQGHVTFGCFSRTIRLNDRVLDAWAAILQAVPGSRLLLNNRAFQEARVRARFAEGFRRRQVGPERLDMVYVSPQAASLSHYGQVDITLDPFPHSAATTVAESLWMGVPVVTLRGATPVGRLGAALLDSAGLESWAASDIAGYCDIAVQLAADLDRLRAARAGLRQHLAGSPFADHRALARRLETLYRRLSGAGGPAPDPQAGPQGVAATDLRAGVSAQPDPAPGAGAAQADEAVRQASALLHAGKAAQALALMKPLVDAGAAGEPALYLLLVALVKCDADAEQGLPYADRLVALAPDRPDYHNLRGVLLRRAGRRADAEAAYRRSMSLGSAPGEADFNLTFVLAEDKRYREAEELMAAFCARAPDRADAWIALGQARQMQMNTRGAIEAYKRGLALSPDNYEGWSNLCPMYVVLEEFEAAVEAGKRATALKPGQKKDLINLAVAEYRLYNLKESEAYCRQVIEISPEYPLVWNNLANIYLDEARFDEAFAAYRRALECDPQGFQHNSNLLFALNYAPDMTAEEIFAEYRQWDERHARPLVPAIARHDNDRDPSRRLRLGYASPDFRNHAAQNFLFPMLEGHDREAVELVLYSECAAVDMVTERYKGLADGWRETYELSDDQLADRIRADRIDIMIDLASHTAHNRLRAMVRRPAPISVSLLVGLGYTTGISAIDYFVGDVDMTPPEAAHLFGETLIRLNRFPMAYRAREGMIPVNALPARDRGHVTFGSLSRTLRLNDHVIATWAKILLAVPGSRLILNNKPYQDPAVRDLFLSRFTAHGVDPDRLTIFRGGVDYRDIDIALDPWPHNAGTTTFEALWSGVPVLSKRDRPSVGRFGISILRALEMSDWVADDTAGYVARAVAAAGDLAHLADLRAGLRQRMAASPLCDGRDLAGQMETAFRAAWQRWCRGEGPAPITIQADGTPRVG